MKWYLTLILVCLGFNIAAPSDFGMWGFVGVKKNLFRGISGYFETELRTREDVSVVDCWSLYGELSGSPCKYLKVGGGYTFVHSHKNSDVWAFRHRFNTFAIGSYSFGNFTLSLRERYEVTIRSEQKVSCENKTPSHVLRSRIEGKYKIDKLPLSPYLTVESYVCFNPRDNYNLEKMRYTSGVAYKVSDVCTLTLYYRYIEQSSELYEDSHIIGLGCTFSLDNHK